MNDASALLGSLALLLTSVGCAHVESRAGEDPPLAAPAPDETDVDESCSFAVVASATGLFATAHGIVLVSPLGEEGVSAAERWVGEGCDLAPQGQPVAVSRLFDVDEHGSLYAFPAGTTAPGILSTLRPLQDPTRDSLVVRVDPDGTIHDVVEALRGIWSFGIAPAGDAAWVTSCGRTGIFQVERGALGARQLAAPSSLWQSEPAVLTDATTFWSVGVRTSAWDAPAVPERDFALVRTTPDGDADVGATRVDFGSGPEPGRLARCGPAVCGLFPGGLVIWDGEGGVIRRLPLSAVAATNERLLAASGNDEGVYLLLSGHDGARVVSMAGASSR